MRETILPFSCSIEDLAIDAESFQPSQYLEIFTLQNQILELIALSVNDTEVLHRLCELEEKLVPGAVASIMILDEATGLMNVLEAPSIPQAGIEMLNGLRPGPGGGSCWSIPVRSEGNIIVGTFALSSFEKRIPDAFQKSLLEIGAFIVGIVLKRREHDIQIKAHKERIRILGAAFEKAREGIMISNECNQIIEVNQAFVDAFGYTYAEVLGKNPKILASGRHTHIYYEQMWKAINEEGYWSGEIWNRCKDGSEVVHWMSISVIHDAQTKAKSYLALTLDISQLKASEEKLSYMAFHDPLTGLANRTKLFDRIDQFIKRSRRSQSIGALLYLDIDRFKNINDSLGHTVGDQMLVEVAERLSSRIRSNDLIARVGGDEFVLWLEDLQNVHEAEIVAEKFLSIFNEPFEINAHEYLLQGSIGIALYPQDARERDSLLKNADAAMYRAKEDPKRKIAFYRTQMMQQAKTSLRLETELYQALKNREFELYFQPKIDARSGKIRGAEALIRWNHPTRGMVMPGDFIPFAEQTSLISQLGEYVLERAFEQLRIWRKYSSVEISMSVNVSGRQLNDDDVNSLLRIIGINIDLAPLIVIELTETFLMHHAHSAVGMLERLKNSGVKLSIDDFGTGYSSLGYLKRFKVDELKIDRLLINDIEIDPNDRVISSAVIAMAHTLGLEVVAEGVETLAQIEILRESGCDLFQGFYFDRPLDAETFFERYLQGSV